MKNDTESKPALKKVYRYGRWSSDAQTDGDSDRRQRQMALDWCQRRGLALAGEETDAGVSAKLGRNRADGSGLSRLLSRVQPGDYLLVEDNDRLTRQDWLTASNFIAQIVDRGVTVVTLQNGNEIDANRFRRDPGCFLPSVLKSFLGNDENVKKAARIRASWEARKLAVERGEKPINANLPGWLRWNPQTKTVDVDETKATVVRRMFELYLQTGKLFEVSRTLNAEGAVRVSRKSNGKHGITKDFIFRCLTNRAVIGECMGKPRLFPAIVTEQNFYRVGERLKAGKHNTTNRTAKATNVLQGLAVCSKCGAPLHKHSQNKHGKVYQYLVCGGALRGTSTCGFASVNYDVLAQSFLGVLLAKDDALLRAVLTGGKVGASDLDVLKAKLADAEQRAEKLCKLIEGEANPSKRLLARLNEIEAEETTLRAQVLDEEAKAKAQPSPVQAYNALRRQFPDPVKITDHARLRMLLADVVAKVVVNIAEDSFEIVLKGGKQPVPVSMIRAG